MSLRGIELAFADGDYLFDLPLPQIKALQESCGVTLFEIYASILKGRYVTPTGEVGAMNEAAANPIHIWEVIRLGLVGGASGNVNGETVEVDATRARKLVEQYCMAPGVSLRSAWDLASAILAARVEGYDPPKKAEPVEPAHPNG